MSWRKLAVVLGVCLLLIAASAYWSARSHGDDSLDDADFAPDEREWTRTLDDVAGSIGGVLGKGADDFDMGRLLPADGLARIGACRATGCSFRFTGATVMRVLPRTDGKDRHSALLMYVVGPADMTYEAADVEYDKRPDAEAVGQDTLVELSIGAAGGRIEFRSCDRTDNCRVRFTADNET